MRTRLWVSAAGVAVLVVWLAGNLLALPPVGERAPAYGLLLAELSLAERRTTNAVAAVLFDLRAFDTLGETFSLFAAAAAVQAVLRELSDEDTREPSYSHARDRRPAATSDAVRAVTLWMVAPTLLYGIYIAARGHVSVGGGFQGGVVVASAVALVYLAGRRARSGTLLPERTLDLAECAGVGGFLVLGLLALVTGAGFLGNVLPLGEAGRLLSAGTIGVLSVLVALEAAAAIASFIQKYAEQALEVRQEQP